MNLVGASKASDRDVEAFFAESRWPGTAPVCPRCSCDAIYTITTRNIHKCKGCSYQFSLTTRTGISSCKIDLRTVLFGIIAFASARQGISSLELHRLIGVQQKTAYLLLMRFRAALSRPGLRLGGVVQVDGCTIGGYRLAENHATHSFGRRYYKRFDNRMVVVVARESSGMTIATACDKEADAKDFLVKNLREGTVLQVDGSRSWNGLRELFDLLRVNHSVSFSANGVHTNMAESFFSLLRKMQTGVHHKITRKHVQSYLDELCWKQDHRDQPHNWQVQEISRLLMAGRAE